MAEKTWMDAARFEQIEALFETLLQKYISSQSSSHGAANSFIETRCQLIQSTAISPMAELSREIKQSLTRMVDLSQEEIDASESLKEALPASKEFSPSTKPTEVPSVSDMNFLVEAVKSKRDFNGEIMQSNLFLDSIYCRQQQ